MAAFFKKMYLGHKITWYIYAISAFVLLLFLPYIARLESIRTMGDADSCFDLFGQIETTLPILCVFWNVFYLDKYFSPHMAEWVFLYEKKYDVLLGMLYNTFLFCCLTTIMYFEIGCFFSMSVFYPEIIKTCLQNLVFTAMLYGISFLFNNHLLGLGVCVLYQVVYFFIFRVWRYSRKSYDILFDGVLLHSFEPLKTLALASALWVIVFFSIGFLSQLKLRKRILFQ